MVNLRATSNNTAVACMWIWHETNYYNVENMWVYYNALSLLS